VPDGVFNNLRKDAFVKQLVEEHRISNHAVSILTAFLQFSFAFSSQLRLPFLFQSHPQTFQLHLVPESTDF
jgi:hypothetical protein